MAIYKLTRKTFSEFTKQAFAEKKAGTLQGSMADRVAQLKAQAAARDAKAVADRAARKVAGTALLAKGLFGGKKQQQAAN